jgi:acyl-CoA reductase-like NAD-dependent aldehyde dehydrogenase
MLLRSTSRRVCSATTRRQHTATLAARPFSSETHGAAVVDSPFTGAEVARVPYIDPVEGVNQHLHALKAAQHDWYGSTTLDVRRDACEQAMAHLEANADALAASITEQMGKPLNQAHNEVRGCLDRGRTMIELAPAALADSLVSDTPTSMTKIAKEPVGTCLVIAPWNYPLMTAVNAIVPAVLAGNSVSIKHSQRTPLVADMFAAAFDAATATPTGLVSALHASHAGTATALQSPLVGYAAFTGSVAGGRIVAKQAAQMEGRFINMGLELGGKDAAYVAEDVVDVAATAAALVDGAMYNAGQSCCGIERVYVHAKHYDAFIAAAKVEIEKYVLGDPTVATTTMGPLAQATALPFIQAQVDAAVGQGARRLTGGADTALGKAAAEFNAAGARFFAPTLVVDCTHDMDVMTEETFGPVMAVKKVTDDADAVRHINDSPYGLTAAVYTGDRARAELLAPQLQVGTVFMNRCDSLDPRLAWTGVKDTGKGASLSSFGFASVVQLKSYNFNLA